MLWTGDRIDTEHRCRAHSQNMADVDPETLLEWLQIGQGDERDMQLIALEQLCMLLLMSDNVDRCFERCDFRINAVTHKYCCIFETFLFKVVKIRIKNNSSFSLV